MEFLTVIPDATKTTVLTRVIGELEVEFYESCARLGIDTASVGADFTATAEPEGSDGLTYVGERQVASLNTRIISCKAALAAIG